MLEDFSDTDSEKVFKVFSQHQINTVMILYFVTVTFIYTWATTQTAYIVFYEPDHQIFSNVTMVLTGCAFFFIAFLVLISIYIYIVSL
jgi:hypothetical protein